MTLTIRGGVLSGEHAAGRGARHVHADGRRAGAGDGRHRLLDDERHDDRDRGAEGVLAGRRVGRDRCSIPPQYAQAQGTTLDVHRLPHRRRRTASTSAFTTTTSAERSGRTRSRSIDPDAGASEPRRSYVSVRPAPQALAALERRRRRLLARALDVRGPPRRSSRTTTTAAGPNVVLSWIDVEATTAAPAPGTARAQRRHAARRCAGLEPRRQHHRLRLDEPRLHRAPRQLHAAVRRSRRTPARARPSTPSPTRAGQEGARRRCRALRILRSRSTTRRSRPTIGWLVFNRIPNDDNLYDQPAAEVFVVPATGGTATRLAANDPPACAGMTSPGITNSWGKWGPTALPGERRAPTTGSSSARSGPGTAAALHHVARRGRGRHARRRTARSTCGTSPRPNRTTRPRGTPSRCRRPRRSSASSGQCRSRMPRRRASRCSACRRALGILRSGR